MRMEFRRLTGELVGQLPWPAQVTSADELRTKAREALAGFYESNELEFWPRERFAANAPEEVRIVSETGEIVVSYTIKDFTADTGRIFAPRG
jgi:formylmethanofuran dehydrogenase subunit D